MSAVSPSLDASAEGRSSVAMVCPVCRASFRGQDVCSRCGADLSPLLLLLAHTFRLRQRARELLRAGDFQRALAYAKEAERLHSTPQGMLLLAVCTCLF